VPADALAQDKPANPCVFEGTVRNSVTRLAISKAAIRLIPLTGSLGYAGASNGQGAFHFEGVAAGDYEVAAQRSGFLNQWALSDSSGRAISTVHLTPGQKLAGNELWFTPESSISGKVAGPDGEPLGGARVTLIVRKWRNGKRIYAGAYVQTSADDGRYRFPDVEPGRYVVYAARPGQGPLAFSIREAPGKPETQIGGRYHPDSAQLDGAVSLDLKGGEEITGIDIKLPLVAVFHVSGKGEAPAESEIAGVSLKPRYHDQTLDWAAENGAVGPDGLFDIAGVAQGTYLLNAFQTVQHDRLVSPKLAVSVSAQDTTGVLAPPVTRFELKGRVRVEGKSSTDAIGVQISCEGSEADEYTSFQRRAEPKVDGTFLIKDLTPDRYAIRIANLATSEAAGYYLKAVLVNGTAAPGDEIDLTAGPAEDVELILSAAIGSADGTVRWTEENSTGRPAPEPSGELTVVIVPEKVASGDHRTQTVFLDQDGHFRAGELEPGSYRLFAVTNYEQGLWQNAEFLRQIGSRGTVVDVTEKGNARVELPVLRAGDIRAVEDRIE
jgi:hypothetical protein